MKIRTLMMVACCSGTSMCGIDAIAQEADPTPSTELPAPSGSVVRQSADGVVVTAKPDPMSRSDRRLEKLQKSLPSTGAGTSRKRDLADKFGSYAGSHSNPNMTTGQERKMMERASDPPSGPDPDAGATLGHP